MKVFARGIAIVCALAIVRPLAASCGSTSCPIDLNALNRPAAGRFTLDLSFQSIDQDQPRISTRKARVGELESPEHDEVRTLNRATTLLLRYAVSSTLEVSASMPYVSRKHDNFEHEGSLEHWDLSGIGDVQLQARQKVAEGLWAIGGVKLPAGAHDKRNDEGEVAEVPIQPGSGSTDWIAGLSYEHGFTRAAGVSGPLGNVALIPFFATITFRRNGSGADSYRFGNEWQLHAGTAYPVYRSLEVLGQINLRVRGRDRNPELDGALDPFTGSSAVFVSPGLRFSFDRAAVYGLVQVPVVQRVNGLQLTSDRNWIGGIQVRF